MYVHACVCLYVCACLLARACVCICVCAHTPSLMPSVSPFFFLSNKQTNIPHVFEKINAKQVKLFIP